MPTKSSRKRSSKKPKSGSKSRSSKSHFSRRLTKDEIRTIFKTYGRGGFFKLVHNKADVRREKFKELRSKFPGLFVGVE